MPKPLSLRRVWFTLAAPPVIFLLVIVAVSVYFGVLTAGDAEAIARETPAALPVILVLVQLALAWLLYLQTRADGLGWRGLGWPVPAGRSRTAVILMGAGAGAALGVIYSVWLSPWMGVLQRTLGDYVPPDSLTPALGASLLPFFIANVLLAPVVEELLYRGYALTQLRRRFGLAGAIVISCLFFGLLHWAGGFWYILLTGLVAGGLFAGLYAWQGTLLAPFAAHLALNLVEFVFVALAR